MKAILLIATLTGPTAWAGPLAFPHQGRLLDVAGQPVQGSHDVTVTLYDGANATVWTRTYTHVAFEDGYFTVVLGGDGTLDQDDLGRAPLYLGLALDGGAEFALRPELASVPFGGRAAGVQLGQVTTCGATTAGTLRWNGTIVQVCNGTAWTALSAL